VCGGACSLLPAVDFNKSCQESAGKFLSYAGVPVRYALCAQCGFCFAPELAGWTQEQFEQRIYNDEYALVDPEYADARPRAHAVNLISMFGDRAHSLQHLDYGGGGGLLAEILNASGWHSISFDPFHDRIRAIEQLGKFELITAFEVFEHVPDVQELLSNLHALLAPKGLVLFSTLLSDGNIHPGQDLDWWYAAPRNGHISLFSRRSLSLLGEAHGLSLRSFSNGFHLFFTEIPHWADGVVPR